MQPKISHSSHLTLRLTFVFIAMLVFLTACSPTSTTRTPTPISSPPTTAPTSASASPTPTSSTASYPALQSISMQDAQNGWGLSQDAAFVTRNGGQQWEDITPHTAWLADSIVKGFFLDSHTAWLLQPAGQDFNHGTLFRTTDGGQNWQSTEVPFGPNPVQFLNANDGWVMADRGAAAGSMAVDIYQTTDGGSTWTKVQSAAPQTQNQPGSLPFGGDKLAMAFSDMQHGWIGGSQPIVGHSYLYKTTDGGKTWNSQDLSIPPAYSDSSVLVYAPKFFNSDDGLLPVNLETQVENLDFYVTQDGGQTWQSTTVVQGSRAYAPVSFQDILVWSGEALNVSHDRGRTWLSVAPQSPLQGKVQQIDFVDQATGWAISMDANENLYLYRTTDGGNTWTELSH
jgi:photosystem II stability/assembly factor-like uncharacterized protein